MKIRKNLRSAGVLLPTLLIATVLGVALTGYLSLTGSETKMIMRSQAWNMAIAVAESGVEEAMTQLNYQEGSNLTANGWTLVNGEFSKTRSLNSDSYYTVSIDAKDYGITSRGFVREPVGTNFIARTIYAEFDTANTIFIAALIGKKHVKAKSGAGGTIDSYDSGPRGFGKGKSINPNASTNVTFKTNYSNGGKSSTSKQKGGANNTVITVVPIDHGYALSGKKDNADVASTSRKSGAIKVTNTKIYGSAAVAPGGKVPLDKKITVDKNSGIGTLAWLDAGNKGVQPGRADDNFVYTFPSVKVPFTSGGMAPSGGKLDGTTYQYILGTGNYEIDKVDLNAPMRVTGDAVLYVKGSFKTKSGSAANIIIDPNSSLKIYVEGHFHYKGDKIANPDVASLFQVYGLDKCKCVKIEKKAEFAGVIYAPRARIKIKSDGAIYGSAVGKCVHIEKGGDFHYDEALNKMYGEFERFVIQRWTEI